MSAALFAAVALLTIAGFAVVQGAVYIATAGFLRLAFASLSLAVLLSLLLSALANITLTTYVEPLTLGSASSGSGLSVAVGLLRALLAAFAQPTVSGIVLLAVLLLVCLGTAQIVGLVEEIHILLEAHKSVASTHIAEAPKTRH